MKTKWIINRSDFIPAYIKSRNELEKKVEIALEQLKECAVCPRDCKVNRLEDELGICRIGRHARVASYFPHFGEEDCLRGWNGSGTIFFGSCNLFCVFCQNFGISSKPVGEIAKPERLAEIMLYLQELGCHNINLVTPEHVVPQVLEALLHAVELGLNLPIVYNTSSYDSLESIKLLDGVVDIYMPDFKFWNAENARKYSGAENYPEAARLVIKEMHSQAGELKFDENGLALRGVLVRHLVMPDMLTETREIMRFLAGISKDTYVNIMDQYRPAGRVSRDKFPEINRGITSREYNEAVRIAREAGLHRFDRRWIKAHAL